MYLERNRRHAQTRILATLAVAALLAGPTFLNAETPNSKPTTYRSTTSGPMLINTESSTGIKKTGTDVITVLEADGRFSTLLTALRSSGLTDELKTGGPYTVFAPTDAAFSKMSQEKRDALLSNRDQLRDVLQYHVVSGRLSAADLRSMQSISQTSYHSSPSTTLGTDRRDANGQPITNSSSTVRRDQYGTPINSTSNSTADAPSSSASTTKSGNAARPDSQEGFVDKLLKDHNEPGDAYDPKGAVNELLGRDKPKPMTVSSTAGTTDTTVANTARVDTKSTTRPSSMAANSYGIKPDAHATAEFGGERTSTGARIVTNTSVGGATDTTYGSRDGSTPGTRAMDQANSSSKFDSPDHYGNTSASVNGSSSTTGADRDRTGSGLRTSDPARTGGTDLRPDSLEGPGDTADLDTPNAVRNREMASSNIGSGNQPRPDSQEGRVDHMFRDRNEPGDAYNGKVSTSTTTSSNTGTSTDVVNSDVGTGNRPRPDSQEGVIDRMLKDKNEPGDAYAPGTDSSGRNAISDAAASVKDSARKASDWVSTESRKAADAIDKTIEPNGNSRIHALTGGGLRFSTSDGVLMVNDAHIVSSDISAGNNVIHAIDKVLTPDRNVSRNNGTKPNPSTSDERSQAPSAGTTTYESAKVVAPRSF